MNKQRVNQTINTTTKAQPVRRSQDWTVIHHVDTGLFFPPPQKLEHRTLNTARKKKNRSALMYENDHPISPVVDWLIQVFYLFPGTCLSSILVVEPSKTRSCPIKTSVVWVPGSWMFSKKNCHIKFWRDIEQLFILNLGTPTFFSQQISQDMGILEKPWHINSNFSKLLAISNIILNWPNYFER